MEKSTPFKRKIYAEELWHYRNPRTADYVPIAVLFPMILIIPLSIFVLNFFATRDRNDVSQASLALTLGLGLNGVLTDVIKILVGRPRPDFFWRCFPNGEMNSEMECTGDTKSEMDGRKSFPSGHSSFAFAGFGFLAWYLMGKLRLFTAHGRGQSWRLIACIVPLLVAAMIAISRTCDYHHHWQDVLVGSLMGLAISYLCYRQYYPSLSNTHCNRSYLSGIMAYDVVQHRNSLIVKEGGTLNDAATANDNEYSNLIDDKEKEVKWI